MERTQLFDLMGELKLYGMKAAFDEIMATEAASVQQGDPAAEIDLPWLPGSKGEGDRFVLSSRFGARPVALVFGSYT